MLEKIFKQITRQEELIRAHRKITELEEELRIVGNNMKSLEISEQEVRLVSSDISALPSVLSLL